MGLPLDIRDLMSSGAKLSADREKPVRLAVIIDAAAPESAVDALREALRPQTGNARLHVEAAVPGDVMVVEADADAIIVLAGASDTVLATLQRNRTRYTPTVVLAMGEERDDVSRRLDQPLLDTLVADDSAHLIDALGAWLVDRLPGKRLSLAANFSFMRRAMAEEAVKSTAFQNAVIGGVVFIPGADMPLMTANQAKMLLQIAAAYGQQLGVERIKELAALVGGGFALRTVARQFVGLVPGLGWAIKAGVGYSGTLAMGYAALEYFESGGEFSGLAEKVRAARDKAIEVAGRRGRDAGVIPAHAWVEMKADAPATPPAELPAPSEAGDE